MVIFHGELWKITRWYLTWRNSLSHGDEVRLASTSAFMLGSWSPTLWRFSACKTRCMGLSNKRGTAKIHENTLRISKNVILGYFGIFWVSPHFRQLVCMCLRTIAKLAKQSHTVVHDNALFRYISTYGLMTLTFCMNRGT